MRPGGFFLAAHRWLLGGPLVFDRVHARLRGQRHRPCGQGTPDADEDIEVVRRPVAGTLGLLSDAGSIAALALWQAGR